MPLSGPQLGERFRALDAFLLEYQTLWRPKPFTHLQLPWEAQHPELAHWLRQRSLAQAEAAHNHPEQLEAPQPFAAIARQSAQLSQLGEHLKLPLLPRPERLSRDIPGRKLAQIQAFASSLGFQKTATHWLDWCAGKGHLGRWLAADGQALTCLEWDTALCASGQALSLRNQINAQHLSQDVLADSVRVHLRPHHSAVALHACGDLHVQLLRQASAHNIAQIAVAPCCYNRCQSDHYQALSAQGQRSTLQLSKEDLALPLSETVTAPLRVRKQRDQSMAWRLGFDLLQRQQRQIDHYLPTPSLDSQALQGSFRSFCHTLAELKHFTLDEHHDWSYFEQAGWQRLAHVRNLELLRNLFRRPLELWLTLDRALYLQEQGYAVKLGTFCLHALSPRNLLLLAERLPVDNSVSNL